MSDDEDKAEPRILTKEAMDRWASLPPDKPLQIALTVRDLDNLFLSIREMIIGQSDLGAVLVHISNNQLEEAKTAFASATAHTNNAMRNIDSLILHAMTTAEPI